MSEKALRAIGRYHPKDQLEKHVLMVLVHHDELFTGDVDLPLLVAHFRGVLAGMCDTTENGIKAVAPARPGRDKSAITLAEWELYAELAHLAADLVVDDKR